MTDELVQTLAQLLSNSCLRQAFREQPQRVLDDLGISGRTRQFFLELPVAQLEVQAKLLIRKRMREVQQLIPLTMQYLGKQTSEIFWQFAENNWPTGHQRHLVDADRFCRFLLEQGHPVNQCEYHRIRFRLSRAKWRLYFVRDAVIAGRRKYAVQFLFRSRVKIHERRFYLSCKSAVFRRQDSSACVRHISSESGSPEHSL
jgi:hypothetical protein